MPNTADYFKDVKTPYAIIRVTRFATYYFKSNEKGDEPTEEQDARNIIAANRMKLQKVVHNKFESDSIFYK